MAWFFQDSDVAKWLEAVAYYLIMYPDPALEARWTNLDEAHALCCAGHMIEAAVAYAQATGKEKPVDIMRGMSDHIYRRFMRLVLTLIFAAIAKAITTSNGTVVLSALLSSNPSIRQFNIPFLFIAIITSSTRLVVLRAAASMFPIRMFSRTFCLFSLHALNIVHQPSFHHKYN